MTNMDDATQRAQFSDVWCKGKQIVIDWDDGTSGSVSAVWLRLACECEICGDSRSGKRWITPADVPVDIAPIEMQVVAADRLRVMWPDNHVSVYDGALIASCSAQSNSARAAKRFRPELWHDDLAERLRSFNYDSIVTDDSVLFASLQALLDHGIARLTGVPAEAAATTKIAERYGPLRETSYGKVFDLYSKPNPQVAGETSRAQIPHTDEPFRYSPPGFIFFHAIKSGFGSEGSSIMVDGFNIAEQLRKQDPLSFELLSKEAVKFHREHDGEVYFEASAHVICLDPDGEITGIRYNDRALAPQDAPLAKMHDLLSALSQFTRLACDPTNQFRHQIQPGEVLVFDNQRILHGRTQFDPQKVDRHLRSCNLDRDAVHSCYRTLARRYQPKKAELALYQGAIM